MLFHENITSKEQMVGWLDKRRPAPASECNRLRRNIYKDWSNIQDFNFKPSRKADQRWGDGNLESGKGALWDADQTLHQEAVEQISKCKPWLSLSKTKQTTFSISGTWCRSLHKTSIPWEPRWQVVYEAYDRCVWKFCSPQVFWWSVATLTKGRLHQNVWKYAPEGWIAKLNNTFEVFFFQDPKITVRVATDYFEVNTLIAFRERERKRDVKIFLSLAFADSTFSNQDHSNNRLRWKSSCLSTSCSSSPDPSMPTSPARLAEFSSWTFFSTFCSPASSSKRWPLN